VNNKFDKDAVMLHNGLNKLGYVAANQAPEVRKYLNEEAVTRGQDAVLVVSIGLIETDLGTWSSSFTVKAVGIVYERIARKYAADLLKEN
jgi:hypothetical protein